jgi:hypothetical protein
MHSAYYQISGTPQRAATKTDMTQVYASPPQALGNRAALFRRRNERIDWRRIGRRMLLLI